MKLLILTVALSCALTMASVPQLTPGAGERENLTLTDATNADWDIPFIYRSIWAGVPFGYGYFGWGAWPVTVGYGYSYWGFYNYLPYYSTFGSIAYSPETGKVGLAWGYSTKSDASSNAVDFCGVADCRPVVWVQGGCAALSVSRTTTRIGWAYADSKYGAIRAANRSCRYGGIGTCKTEGWVCSF